MEERHADVFEYFLYQVRPFADYGSQRGIEAGMNPLLMYHLAVTHPGGLRIGKAIGEPGVMIAHDRDQTWRIQDQIQAFRGIRTNSDAVSGMVNCIAIFSADGS